MIIDTVIGCRYQTFFLHRFLWQQLSSDLGLSHIFATHSFIIFARRNCAVRCRFSKKPFCPTLALHLIIDQMTIEEEKNCLRLSCHLAVFADTESFSQLRALLWAWRTVSTRFQRSDWRTTRHFVRAAERALERALEPLDDADQADAALNGRCLLINAPGGTGKTFVLHSIHAWPTAEADCFGKKNPKRQKRFCIG